MEPEVMGRILVVDDDSALLDALPVAVGLRLPHVKITTAASAADALEQIARIDFDVIVTDIKMPGIDGLALLDRIRSIRPDTPTVLISGHGEHDLTIRALRGGAFDFVQKPIDRDYFVVTLSNAMQTRSYRRKVAAQEEALADYARELETRVEERTRQLQAANDIKDEFLGVISHEMRTPLTVLLGGVDVLQDEGRELAPQAQRELLADMRREGHRLLRIVEDLLIIARAGLDIEVEPARVERLLERVVRDYEARTGRTIRLYCEPGLSLMAAEPTYVERIIENLLSNASKYSMEQTVIDVHAEQLDRKHLCISVLDRGDPISQARAEHFFEPFYRAPESRDRASGHGIGLTVCKRLVTALGGQIWAVPRVEGGLQISFTLPLYAESDECLSANGRS